MNEITQQNISQNISLFQWLIIAGFASLLLLTTGFLIQRNTVSRTGNNLQNRYKRFSTSVFVMILLFLLVTCGCQIFLAVHQDPYESSPTVGTIDHTQNTQNADSSNPGAAAATTSTPKPAYMTQFEKGAVSKFIIKSTTNGAQAFITPDGKHYVGNPISGSATFTPATAASFLGPFDPVHGGDADNTAKDHNIDPQEGNVLKRVFAKLGIKDLDPAVSPGILIVMKTNNHGVVRVEITFSAEITALFNSDGTLTTYDPQAVEKGEDFEDQSGYKKADKQLSGTPTVEKGKLVLSFYLTGNPSNPSIAYVKNGYNKAFGDLIPSDLEADTTSQDDQIVGYLEIKKLYPVGNPSGIDPLKQQVANAGTTPVTTTKLTINTATIPLTNRDLSCLIDRANLGSMSSFLASEGADAAIHYSIAAPNSNGLGANNAVYIGEKDFVQYMTTKKQDINSQKGTSAVNSNPSSASTPADIDSGLLIVQHLIGKKDSGGKMSSDSTPDPASSYAYLRFGDDFKVADFPTINNGNLPTVDASKMTSLPPTYKYLGIALKEDRGDPHTIQIDSLTVNKAAAHNGVTTIVLPITVTTLDDTHHPVVTGDGTLTIGINGDNSLTCEIARAGATNSFTAQINANHMDETLKNYHIDKLVNYLKAILNPQTYKYIRSYEIDKKVLYGGNDFKTVYTAHEVGTGKETNLKITKSVFFDPTTLTGLNDAQRSVVQQGLNYFSGSAQQDLLQDKNAPQDAILARKVREAAHVSVLLGSTGTHVDEMIRTQQLVPIYEDATGGTSGRQSASGGVHWFLSATEISVNAQNHTITMSENKEIPIIGVSINSPLFTKEPQDISHKLVEKQSVTATDVDGTLVSANVEQDLLLTVDANTYLIKNNYDVNHFGELSTNFVGQTGATGQIKDFTNFLGNLCRFSELKYPSNSGGGGSGGGAGRSSLPGLIYVTPTAIPAAPMPAPAAPTSGTPAASPPPAAPTNPTPVHDNFPSELRNYLYPAFPAGSGHFQKELTYSYLKDQSKENEFLKKLGEWASKQGFHKYTTKDPLDVCFHKDGSITFTYGIVEVDKFQVESAVTKVVKFVRFITLVGFFVSDVMLFVCMIILPQSFLGTGN
jgi:hypothetical protein